MVKTGDKKIPICLKRKIMDAAETWFLVKHLEKKIAVVQRSITGHGKITTVGPLFYDHPQN